MKKAKVISGGEKVRCMLAKMMIAESNVLIFDEPTNHLDLEAITSLNNALIDYTGTVLFTSQDYQFIQTVADRIVEISPYGYINFQMKYEDYLNSPDIQKRREEILQKVHEVDDGSGVIVLTDMFGGTPSNLSISIIGQSNVEVLAGLNLPMLIKLSGLRETVSLKEAVDAAQDAGKKYITVASKFLGS